MDTPFVLLVFWAARLGLGIAGANGDTIVDRLNPSCDKLPRKILALEQIWRTWTPYSR